jgi:MoaA/NifB/PqqE/SkfB family radical SAM enzyme
MYNIKSIISKKRKSWLLFPYLNIAWPYPLFLLIHINLSCNRKCGWCYQLNDDFYSLHGKQMDSGAFKNILSAFGFLKPHIHLYGGEPLLHPDFLLLLEYCRQYGFRPTLTTNGDYLDKYSQAIANSSLSQLNISANGLIGISGNIDYAWGKKVKGFLEINCKRKVVNLNYAIEPDTYTYIEDVLSYFDTQYKKGDFASFTLQHFMPGKSGGEKGKQPGIDQNKLTAIFKRVRNAKLGFPIFFLPDLGTKEIVNYYQTKIAPLPYQCYAPWLGLSVLPDLTVTAGAGVLGCNINLGNLQESRILDIWKGRNLNEFRGGILKNHPAAVCHGCCHKFYA